jgi:hypothetical protein
MTNKEQKLKDMWDMTADSIMDALSDPERNTPGWVQCALRFLQDNGADALEVPQSKKDQIAKVLPFPKQERKIG